ncbi:MAG: DHH family phosphoesterase [Alphaproteobacteria bacterium]|nr:DHH family phosphoesterase [Alphaproteobacteria bacterium]
MITDYQVKIFDEKIRAARSIVLCAHKNPDGDALCSVLALAHLIELNYGKEVTCLYDGNIPDNLDEVPLRKKVKYYERVEDDMPVDVAIVLDYGIEKNIGGPHRFVERADFVIEIDHHINHNKIGGLCIDNEEAASTAGIIYQLMIAAGWTWDMTVGRLIMTGIITDTGCFKYVKHGVVMRIVADLIDAGIDIQRIINDLSNKPRKTVVTEAAAVGAAEFFFGNKLAVVIIDNKQYKNLDGRGETVLNLLGQIRGLEYMVLLKEQKQNQIGVSLRGRRHAIDKIAVELGGGGHEFAAGAIVHDTLENVKERVLELFKGVVK